MLDNLLDRFYLVDIYWVTFPVEEVAEEQRLWLVVDEILKLLE